MFRLIALHIYFEYYCAIFSLLKNLLHKRHPEIPTHTVTMSNKLCHVHIEFHIKAPKTPNDLSY